jgi:phosphonate metabolism protein PhnN/1,5-bisphosphokinase (PRPP-forming)
MNISGTLVLVVGPSGAGKDSLIAGARDELAGNPGYVFPRRIVTRQAVAALEDHDSISREAFERERAAGRYALTWEAHGLCYALPHSIEGDMAAGRTVVCNVSRRIIADAREKYPHCAVILITAGIALRAQRLAGRGRETEYEIAARLAREGAPVPAGVNPVSVDNSGTLSAGIAAFVAALGEIAASPLPVE